MDTTTHHCALDLPAPALVATGRRRLGDLGEDLACRHLTADDGLRIVARNWRLSEGELRGELDIVAVDDARGCVVVCEVKTRRDAARFGGAISALSHRQGRKIRALTGAFLRDAAMPQGQVRIDLVAVDLGHRPTLTHVIDAL